MANRGLMPEGYSINRPPYFDGSNYTYWKNRMHVFLRAQEHNIWRVVSKGPFDLPSDEDQWTEDQVKKSSINFNAMNIMQCAIDPNEFSRISMCISAKEMWDKLALIYEGTSEVRETKANMLVQDYELFKMKSDETISEMFARLSQLTNGLKALGKEYTNAELVRKVLRSLPPAWHTKATVIEDSKNLSIMTLDELIGSLMTYEINMRRNTEEIRKKKAIALKAASSSKDSSEDEAEESNEEEDDEDVAMFTRQIKKFLRRKRRPQFKGRPPFKKNFQSKGESNKKEPIICYECKKTGHMRGECPELLKKAKCEKGKKPRAMVATWSDEEPQEVDSEDMDDLMESLCLMANGDEVTSETESISNEQWETAYLTLYSKYKKIRSENKSLKMKIENMAHVPHEDEIDLALQTKNASLKIDLENLNSKVKDIESLEAQLVKTKKENEELFRNLSKCQKQVVDLQKEIVNKENELKNNQFSLKKFDKGKQTLNNLLSIPMNFQNEGLGFIPNGKQKAQQANKKITFVASSSKPPKSFAYTPPNKKSNAFFKGKNTFFTPKFMHAGKAFQRQKIHIPPKHLPHTSFTSCYYCGKSGHLIANCIARKNSQKTRAVWIPKHLIHNATNIRGPKGTWVPKVTR